MRCGDRLPSGQDHLTQRDCIAHDRPFHRRRRDVGTHLAGGTYVPSEGTPKGGRTVFRPCPRAAGVASGTKGDHLRSGWSEGRIVQLRVTRGGEPDTLAVRKAMLVASHRYEWIFVSTNPGNARIVFIDRVMSQPS
jgi:hypothetical protein